jgi:uncharacterized protein DUF5818
MMRIAVAVAVLLVACAAVGVAAPRASQPLAPVATAQNQSEDQPKVQTFTGTITKNGDQFLFSDEGSKKSYQLDDQKTASRFDGKKVKVTGTLDAANNLIRVQSIEPASA